MTKGLTHVDDKGAARMVDVGAKPATRRRAVAKGMVRMAPETVEMIVQGRVPKGDALAVARVAGIMAAKRTPELVPLCHPLPISSIMVDLTAAPGGVAVEAEVTTTASTGVEMEALTAVTVAGLALYDMIKAVDRSAEITDVRLVEKSGGKSGDYRRE